MKQVFICDLDGVLINTAKTFAKKWSEILGTEVAPEDFTSWDTALALGIDPAYEPQFWDEVWDEWFELYPGAVRMVESILKLGYDFIIVTSRCNEAAKRSCRRSIDELSALLPPYAISDVIIADDKPKSVYINEIQGASFFLDDHVKNAVDAKLHCPGLKEVMLLDRPWNKSSDLCGYLRVFSYHGVLVRLYKEQ